MNQMALIFDGGDWGRQMNIFACMEEAKRFTQQANVLRGVLVFLGILLLLAIYKKSPIAVKLLLTGVMIIFAIWLWNQGFLLTSIFPNTRYCI